MDVDISEAELSAEMGTRGTFLQFSTAFCQPCRATRATLAWLTGAEDDVAHIEIDAESHLDLVRRVGVERTPTTLVLDGTGRVIDRIVGALSLNDARAALLALPPTIR